MVCGPAGNRRFSRSGRPQKPFKNMGGEAPHLFEWFVGPPGPPRPRKSMISGRSKNHVLKTKVYSLPLMRVSQLSCRSSGTLKNRQSEIQNRHRVSLWLPSWPSGAGGAPALGEAQRARREKAEPSPSPGLLEWFLGPPGPSRPQKSMISGS